MYRNQLLKSIVVFLCKAISVDKVELFLDFSEVVSSRKKLNVRFERAHLRHQWTRV